MKKISTYIFFFAFFSTCLVHSQSQWKFHIAFEDGTGAKDTIWCIWDTAATLNWTPGPYDTLFNEGPAITNTNVFNVWIYNNNLDSTKTLANPYFPFVGFQLEVRAINLQYPIYISWDSSLFNTVGAPDILGNVYDAKIDNDYFFAVNNDPPAQMFNMLWDNHVTAPFFAWGSQSQFPMSFYISGQLVNINSIDSHFQKIDVFPNPFSDNFTLKSNDAIASITLTDLKGQVVYTKTVSERHNNSLVISIPNHIPEGIYIVKALTTTNLIYYEKILKTSP
ncbi:MAG: T9SS type A sorting domain-containing protein [Bacteroidota bacterium]